MTIRGLRWWIVALVFLAAVLNYVDRQTLSALAPTIQADLKMDDRDYADIVNWFLVAYTVAHLVSGKLVDRLGTRTGTALVYYRPLRPPRPPGPTAAPRGTPWPRRRSSTR